MKIKIEEYPNKELLGIHTSIKVSNKNYVKFYDPSSTTFANDEEKTEELCYLAAALFAIEGIKEVTISTYEILLQKSPACEWKDLIPDILHVIKQMIAKGKNMEELPRKTMSEEERTKIQRNWERASRDFDFFDEDDDL